MRKTVKNSRAAVRAGFIKGGNCMENNKRPETMERITTPELAQQFIDEQVAAVKAQVGGQEGPAGPVRRGGLLGGGRPSHPRHRQAAGVRPREPRPAAQGRARAGGPGVRHEMDANLIYVDAVDRFLEQAGRGGRAREEAQDHRRGVHPGVRGGGPEGWRASSSWPRAPSTPTSWRAAR